MPYVTLQLELPADLAHAAEEGGLSSPEAVEGLFAAADALAADGTPPMTSEEIDAEIDAARAERRQRERDALRR